MPYIQWEPLWDLPIVNTINYYLPPIDDLLTAATISAVRIKCILDWETFLFKLSWWSASSLSQVAI